LADRAATELAMKALDPKQDVELDIAELAASGLQQRDDRHVFSLLSGGEGMCGGLFKEALQVTTSEHFMLDIPALTDSGLPMLSSARYHQSN
jgi:hypothetical protein